MTIGLTFAFVGLSRLADMPWLQDVDPLTPELVVAILTLHRTYYLVDVMLLYHPPAGGLAPGPPAPDHRAHLGGAAPLQAGCGSSSSGSPAQAQVPWTIVNNDTFGLRLAGVVLRGMVIGYHGSRIWRILGRVPPLLASWCWRPWRAVWLRLSDGALLAGRSGRTAAGPAALEASCSGRRAPGGAPAGLRRLLPLLYLALTYTWGRSRGSPAGC